jgi:hypothetical protein
MATIQKMKDLGLTMEEAVAKGTLSQSYQILGKFYTEKTAHAAPEVQLGQCPVRGRFSWNERDDKDWGECSECGFSG